MNTSSHVKTLAALASDALSQVGKLLQNEFALAKAELSKDISRMGVNLGLLVGGALLLIPALVLLLFALAAALIANGFSPAIAYLASGLFGLVIAFALIAIAFVRIKAMSLVPERTIRQLHKDQQTISEVTR